MRRALPISCLMSLMALSACAPRGEVWINPDAGREQWPADRAECRRLARQEEERDFLNNPHRTSNAVANEATRVSRNFALIDARRRGQRLFETCMRRRGYIARR